MPYPPDPVEVPAILIAPEFESIVRFPEEPVLFILKFTPVPLAPAVPLIVMLPLPVALIEPPGVKRACIPDPVEPIPVKLTPPPAVILKPKPEPILPAPSSIPAQLPEPEALPVILIAPEPALTIESCVKITPSIPAARVLVPFKVRLPPPV